MTALEEESYWIAVDVWGDSDSLAAEMAAGPVPLARLCEVMTQVGTALSELHAAGVILRELHPESILIRRTDRSCLLTDLELAKFLEVDATVSRTWQLNPYRAPEVAAGEAKSQADIHSFARLLTHLLLGVLPDFPEDAEALRQRLAPTPLLDLLTQSLSPNWKQRPGSIHELLHSLPQLALQ